MNKSTYLKTILKNVIRTPVKNEALAYAPSNIALVKYWGKRNNELNLPVTSSLSISLADKGAICKLSVIDSEESEYFLNGTHLTKDSIFVKRLQKFLDLFIPASIALKIETESSVPIAAGLASSACGFAALTKALNDFCDWQLNNKELSMIARLGSGSAARSLWHGFVEWQAGNAEDGSDCYAESLSEQWPDFCIGLLLVNQEEKKISSREAMQRTVESSSFYQIWPQVVSTALQQIKSAIHKKDFSTVGQIAENNALAMHATMLTSQPPVLYWQPETVSAMHKIWQLRENGLTVYFTEDAGPNLKLLFLESSLADIKKHFPNIEIVKPFAKEINHAI